MIRASGAAEARLEMSVRMGKLTATASMSLGTVEPPAQGTRPPGNGPGQDVSGLGRDLPCADDPELFFAESPDDVETAKALCRECPARIACLAGALERLEPWGVWGGELFLRGSIVPRKRPRGRPRKTDVAA